MNREPHNDIGHVGSGVMTTSGPKRQRWYESCAHRLTACIKSGLVRNSVCVFCFSVRSTETRCRYVVAARLSSAWCDLAGSRCEMTLSVINNRLYSGAGWQLPCMSIGAVRQG